jgi:hypothetical protein
MSKTSVSIFEVLLVYCLDNINIISARISAASAILLLTLVIVITFCLSRITGNQQVKYDLEIKVPQPAIQQTPVESSLVVRSE